MSVGKQILNIRKERELTQEEFGKIRKLRHFVLYNSGDWLNYTKQNDEVFLCCEIEELAINLDKLLKEDSKMIKEIDRARSYGNYIKKEKSIVDFFTGAGTGIVIPCFWSPDTIRRTIAILIGITMILIGWYKKEKYYKEIIEYVEKQDKNNVE